MSGRSMRASIQDCPTDSQWQRNDQAQTTVTIDSCRWQTRSATVLDHDIDFATLKFPRTILHRSVSTSLESVCQVEYRGGRCTSVSAMPRKISYTRNVWWSCEIAVLQTCCRDPATRRVFSLQ